MSEERESILSDDLRRNMVYELAQLWMYLCDDDRETVKEMVFNGFVGYNKMSDKELIEDYRCMFIDGADEDDDYSYLWRYYHEAQAQLTLHGVLTSDEG